MNYIIKVIREHDHVECGEVIIEVPAWPVDAQRAQRMSDQLGVEILRSIAKGEVKRDGD